jgi:hypothetical protein
MIDEARDVFEAKNKTEIIFFLLQLNFLRLFQNLKQKSFFFTRVELERKKISLITVDFMP